MKRITLVTMLLACGFLAAGAPLYAQTAGAVTPENWFAGKATLLLLGRDDVDSSKFEEYRVVPKGVSMPAFSLMGGHNGIDYALVGENIYQEDQRYRGWAGLSWLGVKFDYNSIVHNMGFSGRTLFTENAPGVWNMSAYLRKYLGDAVDAVPSTSRTYPFYLDLLSPTLAAAPYEDLTSLRQRGNVEFDLGKKLPFDLQFTYLRELKTGARGDSNGDVYGVVNTVVDFPETMDEVVQDIGVKWAWNFKAGGVYARLNRNTYSDNLNALVVDNPFRVTDLAYVSTSVPGGPAQGRFGVPPDNEATRGAFGILYKMKKQTRLSADLAFNTWTQNEQFLPYTINSAIFTPTGAPANALSTLPQQSLDGKINTSMFNFAFSSRPTDDLSIRLRYRAYELTNETTRFVIPGDAGGSPDRSWSVNTPTPDAPYGHPTANPYDHSTKRFDLQASYDIGAVSLEGSYRNGQLERTSREAHSGDENMWGVAAVWRTGGMFDFKAMYDSYERTAEGETIYGFQEDEAEKTVKRTGLEVELSPFNAFGMTFTYYRNDREYPNRPNRVPVVSGVPVPGVQFPNTPSGLIEAAYDTFTLDFEYVPSERAEIGAWYTDEKDTALNRWHTTTTVAGTPPTYTLNNSLSYAGTERGDSFGVNAMFTLVPDKWKLAFLFTQQKIDGLMDITALETGSFYNPGRTTLIPPGQGGAADIADYDDTEWTTANLSLAYTYNPKVTLSVGYAYDKYTYTDAYNANNSIFVQSPLFFMQENNGNYTANVVYTKLSVRF
jgi:Putative outer membrane beta-barrel porin, MtrB/PioB